jgi:hypothetical protein
MQGGIAPLPDRWNEALRIEEALGDKARFAGREALPQFRRSQTGTLERRGEQPGGS